MNITPSANISGTAGRGRPVRHPGRNFFPPRGETQTTEEFLMKKASTGTGPCSGGAGAVPEISASARGSRAGASAALRGGSPGGSVARRRRRRRRKGTHESRGGMAGAGSICARRCHDCGEPTSDYRCPACLAAWRTAHGVPEDVDDADDEHAYFGACFSHDAFWRERA